jgi:hypothetical protein
MAMIRTGNVSEVLHRTAFLRTVPLRLTERQDIAQMEPGLTDFWEFTLKMERATSRSIKSDK